MTGDDRFEEFLQREARGLDAPSVEVPREEMWSVIARARAASREPAGGGAVAGSIPVARARRLLRRTRWIGMAAMLLLGVGLGRSEWFGRRRLGPVTAPPSVTSSASRALPSGALVESTARDAAPVPSVVATVSEPRNRGQASGAPVRNGPDASARERGAVTRGSVANSSSYQFASQQHLTRAEALVSVVATMSGDALMDSLTATWARDILTNTRLLLDSPAGDDPVRRKLLEDLETVLVQLVQRSGRTAEDRTMIDRTLERTQLLTRLRSGASGT